MSEQTAVSWDGLQYYDRKIKEYIEDEISKSSSSTTDVAVLEERVQDNTTEIALLRASSIDLQEKVSNIDVRSARNEENIEHLLEDVNDLEELARENHLSIDELKEGKSEIGHKHFVADIIDFPASFDVDLSNYYTKEQVYNKSEVYTKSEVQTLIPDITSKADNIVFTEDAYVGTSLGGFITGDSLKGLSLKQILTKLLDVKSTIPDNPPIEDSIVKQILENSLTTYILNIENELVANSFYHRILTAEEAEEQCSGSFFFTIPEQSLKGYQIDTDNQRHDYLTVSLPDVVTDFKVQQFDMIRNSWQEVGWKFTPKTEQVIGGYTTYTASNVLSGHVIRIIIEN